jgi:hypothetical protein|tara:strand:+ start:2481 stop:2753 length:273 start_codon:yes stop_codon:yes gene_type:complete
MSKLSQKDADKLVESGILSDESIKEMQGSGFVSKKRTSTKRFMKTADGTWVSPMLYFRGGKNTKQSKKQNELVGKFNKLIEQYTTVQNSK